MDSGGTVTQSTKKGEITFKKKPKLSKKERRELQERQRAAKAAKRGKGKGDLGVNNSGVSLKQKSKEQMVKRTHTQKRVGHFSHLPQYERESSLSLNIGFSAVDALKIHPAILALGLKYGEGTLSGANSRAVAMLLTFKEVIEDYETPQGQALCRDLDKHLKPLIQFLIDCRPHSVTMGNAIKHVRHAIANIPPEMSESDGKKRLFNIIDDFIRTHITMAQEEIVNIAQKKIVDSDVVLTFARSHVVEKLMLYCHQVSVELLRN